jgi:cellulose synthase/poly-beta-1,6-N-acetylglucosamine synthase-like glycosyltransferase
MAEWATAPVSCLLGIISGTLAILGTILLVEVVAAFLRFRRREAFVIPTGNRPRVAVLVPAHDESACVLPTLRSIQAQLRPEDRLLVVADNCSDDTAAIALAAGVEVTERNDRSRKGKGYALDWGVRHLRSDPPDVVIVIDADCRLQEGALETLATASEKENRPVQALYIMTAPANSVVGYRISEFAWRVKNWVRPLGLKSLGLPCQLMGTGMAFPWHVIRGADLASGHIVEDLKLGLDLTAAGLAPLFCTAAVVTSEFPQSVRGVASQRQRWEHGHISMISMMPALVVRAIAGRNWRLLALALDMAVPPLGLLGLLTIMVAMGTALSAALALSALPFLISCVGLASLAVALVLSWCSVGRNVLPARSLLSLVPFVLGKLALYGRLIARGPVSQWTRTDRN